MIFGAGACGTTWSLRVKCTHISIHKDVHTRRLLGVWWASLLGLGGILVCGVEGLCVLSDLGCEFLWAVMLDPLRSGGVLDAWAVDRGYLPHAPPV